MQVRAQAEKSVWKGSPSQWLNLKAYLLCSLGSLLAVIGAVLAWQGLSSQAQEVRLAAVGAALVVFVALVIIAIKKFLELRCTRYHLTTERIRITTGILSTQTEDTELYRVDDIKLERPFLMRLVGLGNIIMVTSDRTTPNIILKAISKSEELRDTARIHIEECRDRKQTRVLDMN
ncbi:MAG: PH domain-containing protein [Chloroflexota bacterium]|jgi:uncharacterized membrane protein YdbT with pleckstrin-like domain